jgi:hypothetical protein
MTSVSLPNPVRAGRSPRRAPVVVVAVVLAAVVVAGLVGVVAWRMLAGAGPDEGPDAALSTVAAIDVDLPAGWVADDLREVDRKAGVVARANRSAPAAAFLARAVAGELEADATLDAIGAQTEQALTRSLAGFELVGRDRTTLDGHDGVRIDYRQPGAGGAVMRARMVIVPMADRTYYLTVRAADSDFDAVGADAVLAAAGAQLSAS